jgi:heme-degrading monooxygenase HmoA
MIIHMSIHTPREGRAQELIDSMHRFGAAGQGRPGFVEALTLRDGRSGRLVGMARWEDEASWRAGVEAMHAAVEDDPFDEWEDGETQSLMLDVV